MKLKLVRQTLFQLRPAPLGVIITASYGFQCSGYRQPHDEVHLPGVAR